jgi:DNA-binding winged helix-turn-helix (wHTH) protein
MSGLRVDLPEKALEALVYLAQHPDDLVTTAELTKHLWGARPVHGGSVRHLITELRSALNDDWRNPRYIQTVHSRRGYKFIAELSNSPGTSENLGEKPRTSESRPIQPDESAANYQITSHIFAPVYLGSDLSREIKSPVRVSQWLSYKELQIENGRLCILPNGIGVWHLESTDRFATLSDHAQWRKRSYETIFSGRQREHRQKSLSLRPCLENSVMLTHLPCSNYLGSRSYREARTP